MMLSNEDIEAALKSGELKVEPFFEGSTRAAGITLHLGEKLLKPRPGTIVDVKKRTTPVYDEILLADDKPYIIQPQEFILGHTFERVTVGSKLGFLIEGRSTLARVGLTIVQTAMLVYPGHHNRAVTLEFANHGPNPIALYPKMKIARVVLFELKTAATVYYDDAGKYREQGEVGPPIFLNEINGKAK